MLTELSQFLLATAEQLRLIVGAGVSRGLALCIRGGCRSVTAGWVDRLTATQMVSVVSYIVPSPE